MLSAADIKAKAKELGFSQIGISGDIERKNLDFQAWWLAQGFAAGMDYLARQQERRQSITKVLPTARSVIVCSLRFPGGDSTAPATFANEKKHGKVARYAQGQDYHFPMREKLAELARFIDESAGLPAGSSLAYVDTGALNERALAAQAGVGWIGKNAMLIHPEEGSWTWLGEVLTPLELERDAPLPDRCGTCTACLDACPTQAILPGARAVDSRACIAYWTIEYRGAEIPSGIAEKMGDWLMGCDICQEVCPWNNASLKRARKAIGEPVPQWFPLEEIQGLSAEEFRSRFRETALSRPKLAGLKRNAETLLAQSTSAKKNSV